MALTNDHRSTTPSEYDRVREKGGFFVNGMTNGVLALTRTLGDKELTNVVDTNPDIFVYHRQDNDLFLVVACDGVWDVLSVGEVFQIVQTNKHLSSPSIASLIRNIALCKGTTDNVSCIVCKLQPTQNSPPV